MGKTYDQLDIDERYEIYRLRVAGVSLREIGRVMGRSALTISRELARNSLPRGGEKPGSGRPHIYASNRPDSNRSRLGTGIFQGALHRCLHNEVYSVEIHAYLLTCAKNTTSAPTLSERSQ